MASYNKKFTLPVNYSYVHVGALILYVKICKCINREREVITRNVITLGVLQLQNKLQSRTIVMMYIIIYYRGVLQKRNEVMNMYAIALLDKCYCIEVNMQLH